MFDTNNHTVEAFNHLDRLLEIRECMIVEPELFSLGARGWVEEEIADMELDLLGVQKEKAAGQGDFISETLLKTNENSILPAFLVGK